MEIKKIIITGVTGQDGSNMVRYLLKHVENVEIYGTSCISVQNNLNLFHCELKQSLPASIDKSHPNFLTRSAAAFICVFS